MTQFITIANTLHTHSLSHTDTHIVRHCTHREICDPETEIKVQHISLVNPHYALLPVGHVGPAVFQGHKSIIYKTTTTTKTTTYYSIYYYATISCVPLAFKCKFSFLYKLVGQRDNKIYFNRPVTRTHYIVASTYYSLINFLHNIISHFPHLLSPPPLLSLSLSLCVFVP